MSEVEVESEIEEVRIDAVFREKAIAEYLMELLDIGKEGEVSYVRMFEGRLTTIKGNDRSGAGWKEMFPGLKGRLVEDTEDSLIKVAREKKALEAERKRLEKEAIANAAMEKAIAEERALREALGSLKVGWYQDPSGNLYNYTGDGLWAEPLTNNKIIASLEFLG